VIIKECNFLFENLTVQIVAQSCDNAFASYGHDTGPDEGGQDATKMNQNDRDHDAINVRNAVRIRQVVVNERIVSFGNQNGIEKTRRFRCNHEQDSHNQHLEFRAAQAEELGEWGWGYSILLLRLGVIAVSSRVIYGADGLGRKAIFFVLRRHVL
jgi:hypothetical protein